MDQRNFYDHPIHDSRLFRIHTPMIEGLKVQITQWLWCGSTGAVIIGSSRSGKSMAVKEISKGLKTRSGEWIRSVYLSIPRRDQPTISGVLREIAIQMKLDPRKSDTADMMANDIVHNLGEMAISNNSRQIVLFVDEFQRLHITQLSAFVELHDALLSLGCSLTVIFVGNEGESNELLSRVKSNCHDHIRGRYFIDGVRFSGIESEQDLKICLEKYDTDKYPMDGPSVTEFFVPTAYRRDHWRLASLSNEIWNIYNSEYAKPHSIASWGMRYFSATIRILLSDYLPTLETMDIKDIRKMIINSIDVSGIVSGLVERKPL